MKRNFVGILLSMTLIGSAVFGQDYGITFSGFVKTDHFFDTRQNVTAREDHFLLYPAPEVLDENEDDVNAAPSFNQLAIQTRLRGNITAPDAFGAKTAGYIEGEFFGHSNGDINGFRLRHAWVRFNWDNTTLLFGQYWHPMFVTAVFPGVVSFNTGVPFQPFSRNPQIRLEQKMGDNATLILAALSQRDFASTGPDGTTSDYLRDAVVPNLHAQLQASSGGSVFGAGVDFKMLRPRLAVNNMESTERVTGISFIGYGKANLGQASVEVEATLGQNLTDHLMLGGYAVKATSGPDLEYTTVNNFAIWGEIYGNGTSVQPGVFVGYTQNQGASDDVATNASVYARGTNLKSVLRVSPRLIYNSGKARLAGEVDFTQAGYATSYENEGIKLKPDESESVSNIRLLFAAYIFF